MTTTPTLPPLPPPEIVELGGKKTAYYAATTQKLREAAYQAGLSVGFDTAFRHAGLLPATNTESEHYARMKAEILVGLKSDAKE